MCKLKPFLVWFSCRHKSCPVLCEYLTAWQTGRTRGFHFGNQNSPPWVNQDVWCLLRETEKENSMIISFTCKTINEWQPLLFSEPSSQDLRGMKDEEPWKRYCRFFYLSPSHQPYNSTIPCCPWNSHNSRCFIHAYVSFVFLVFCTTQTIAIVVKKIWKLPGPLFTALRHFVY